MQGSYTYIECKQATRGLLGASRHLYGHNNTASRTGTDLKRRHCVFPVSIFVVWHTRVAVSLHTALSREDKVMVDELTGHGIANADAPNERKLDVLQT